MDVPAPEILKKPLVVPYKTLMGPGPSNSSPRVLHAMSQSVLGHMHQETFQIMDEIKEGIRYVFQTKNNLTLAISASGHAGMEAVLSNLVEPGERVLVGVNGLWGLRATNIAERYGALVTKLNKSLGDNFSLAELEHHIRIVKPKLVFLIQGESSTGVYQPIEGVGDICERYDCLLAVDTVASLGGVPFFADKWKVDAVYSGSQKVLGAPPGLAIISFSPKAQKVISERKTPVPVYYWDMLLLGQQWNCFNNVRPYHHTTCSNLLCALREGLAIIAEEGLENVIKRHENCARKLQNGLQSIGLELFVEEEHKRLPTVTSLRIPKDLDWKEITAYAMTNYRLEITGGLGPTIGKILRIGLMGYNATPENVDFLLKVLKETLENVKTKKSSKL